MTINRNDPCPCGSGLKYKRCHLGKPLQDNSKHWKLVGTLAAVFLVATIVVWLTLGSQGGILTAGAGVLVVGAIALFTDPPDSKPGGSDPSAISFGR